MSSRREFLATNVMLLPSKAPSRRTVTEPPHTDEEFSVFATCRATTIGSGLFANSAAPGCIHTCL
jgi:hypothetical protein